jgi:DNA repair protein RadC
MEATTRKPTLQKIPVYEVRLIQARRSLRLAESTVPDASYAGRTMHALLGLTDREHFAALFLNGMHRVTGANVIAIGGQHGIGTIEARTVFRAAIAACASASRRRKACRPTKRRGNRRGHIKGLWGARCH